MQDDAERAREIERLIMDHVRLEVRPGRARMDADSITDAARAILAAQQPEGWRDVKCVGVTRMFDNDLAVLLSLREPPTDDQLRAIHELLRGEDA